MAAGIALSQGRINGGSSVRACNGMTPGCSGVVRELFISRTTQAGLVCGTLEADAVTVIESMMSENGVIFSDGIEADTLEFNAGTLATVGLASRKARLVVP